jgi:hypothetical protein
MNAPASSLSQFAAAMRDPDPDGAWKLAETIWKQHGVVVLVLSDIERKKGWSTARSARNLAEICYGKNIGGK